MPPSGVDLAEMLAALVMVGSLALRPCHGASGYACGTLRRPLDPSGRVKGSIPIAFTWLAHARHDAPSQGVIVAAEGGPGYPSGASRAGYRELFGRLLQTHDLLLMDDRGTGNSDAIDCPPLQRAMTLPNVTRCGAQLGASADLYGSALAADDLAALLHALHIARIDLYGDSYGTFFAQTFAARHPTMVRSIVLDGAYPVVGGDPWYPSVGTEIRRAFNLVCQRSRSCAARGGSAMARIRTLVGVLRTRGASVTPTQLAFVMATAGLDPIVYRELDAAARAYLRSDRAPLVRLAREAYAYEESAPSDPRVLSQGLFAAASCSDNPQVYDMRAPPHERIAQWNRALTRMARVHPTMFAPFSLEEYLTIPLDYAYVPLCQTWPVAAPEHPAGTRIPPGMSMPAVPTLVLTGDLDTITTPEEGDAAAALFPDRSRVIVANEGHVTGIDDPYDCASRIIRSFIAHHRYDAHCASRIPPLRLVRTFARSSGEVPPAHPLPPNRAATLALRRAATAVLAAGDALARANDLGAVRGTGLRGGSFTASSAGSITTVHLADARWTRDLAISGTVTLDAASGQVRAQLRFLGGTLTAAWNAYERADRARLVGRVDGAALDATMRAP